MKQVNKEIFAKALGLTVHDIVDGMHFDQGTNLSGEVIKNVDLSDTRITEVPKGFSCTGFLSLRNTPIADLEDDMKIGGFLDIVNTNISKFPKRLKTGSSITIGGSLITDFDHPMHCGGDFDFGDRFIPRIPEFVFIEGSIFLPTENPDA